MCVGSCGLLETENRLFLECNVFDIIWQLVRNWLGVHSTNLSIITNHFFLQFGSSLGYSKSRSSFMLLIWFASSWMIWKKRNDRIFRGKESTPLQFSENTKFLSF